MKILLFPFFIIVTLVLIIGYIKPDIDVVLEKMAEMSDKEAKLANAQAVIENIRALNNSLDTEQKSEQFTYQYLPKGLNQEQVIDAFNFLALQSGLAISGMELKLPQEKIADEEPAIDNAARSFVAGGKTLNNTNAPVSAQPVTARTFVFKGAVTGPYASIKSFFDRLSRIERFQKVRSFVIETPKKTESAKPEIGDDLTGTFEVEYGYLPVKPVASALEMPIFLQSKFDFSKVNALISQITSPMPALEKGTAGKPNPFQ